MIGKESASISIVILLVLASLGSAELVFTVEAAPQPPEVWLCPWDVIELGLDLVPGENILRYQLMYTLTNDQAEFIVDGGSHPSPRRPMTDIEFPWASAVPGKVNAQGPGWLEIAADNLLTPAEGPLLLMRGLYIQPLGLADVLLTVTVSNSTVVDGVEIPIGTQLHTLHIIVPEPTTLLLLVVGGLIVLRKRRLRQVASK